MKIKRLFAKDCEKYQKELTYYIYESVKNAAFEESYVEEQAYQKYQELHDYLDQEKAIVFGAFEEQRLIGFLWSYPYPFRDDKKRLYVSILHIDSEFRNKHYGEELLKKMEDVAVDLGFQAIYLHAEAQNQGALRFYERAGYKKERIQLVKQVSSMDRKGANTYRGGGKIQRLNKKYVKEKQEVFARLYEDNIRSHMYINYFCYNDAMAKIEEFADYLDEEKAIGYCITIRGEIAGFIWAYPYSFQLKKRLYIGAIQIFEKYRRQALATRLYEMIDKEMDISTIQSIYTHVDAENKVSLAFHYKQSFQDEIYQMVKQYLR